VATDEKKEPARRRRAAAVTAPEAEQAPKAPRPARARKAPKADAAEQAAEGDGAAVPAPPPARSRARRTGAPGAPTTPPEAAPVEVVGAPTASPGVDATASDASADPGTPAGQVGEGALTAEEVTSVLGKLLALSGFKARLETQDAADGALSVAVHFDPVPAGIQAGRRTPLMESLQFLTNKLVNRPGSTSRRWVALGAMGHPPPRGAPGTRAAKAAPAAAPAGVPSAAAPAGVPSAATPPPARAAAPVSPGARPQHEGQAGRTDERSLTVEPDAALAEASRRLAGSAAALGRYYVLFPMGEQDRARVVQASAGIAGVRVSCEGEGRHRRVVFKPDAPAPLPKQTLPDYDDEDEDDDAA